MKYIGKKIIIFLFTIFILSFLVFFSFTLISGDVASAQLGTSATAESLALLREELGLNRPLYIRYFEWLFSFLKGDLGKSYQYNMPVAQLIGEKLPITLTMAVMAFSVILAVSVPISLYMMKKEGKVQNKLIYFINHICMAIPPFFAGILITIIFGFIFKLFTPGNYISYKDDIFAFLGYMIFPSVAIAIPKIGMSTKLLYSSLCQESKMNYVRTAYSKGNNTHNVIYKHILKNAMIPAITFLGMILADIITGSIVIEQVFAIPGLGKILLTSILNRDFPVVQAIIMMMAAVIILINTLVDILYHIIDPRMEIE